MGRSGAEREEAEGVQGGCRLRAALPLVLLVLAYIGLVAAPNQIGMRLAAAVPDVQQSEASSRHISSRVADSQTFISGRRYGGDPPLVGEGGSPAPLPVETAAAHQTSRPAPFTSVRPIAEDRCANRQRAPPSMPA